MKKLPKKYLIGFLAALLAFGVLACTWTRIAFTNASDRTVEVHSQFSDDVKAEKVHVLLPFWRESIPVSHSEVSTETIGQQTVTYTAGQSTVTRSINVVDSKAPEILLTVTDSYTLPGHEYQEEGYKATDNYDGDITAKVITSVNGDIITYSVSDSSGNMASVDRKINYTMKQAPTITVKNQTINVGAKFTDSYSAKDEGGNDITDRVAVSGTVNTSKEGTYTLTYDVEDDYGNQASKTATIKVVKKSSSGSSGSSSGSSGSSLTVTPGAPNGKIIYLTFDDGPSAYEEQLLQILAKYNVKVTFFVTGYRAKYRDNFRKMHEQGHVVAPHSYSHEYKQIYASSKAYWEDYEKILKVIMQYTGTDPKMFRFPGGSSNTVSKFNKGIMTKLAKEAKEKGLVYYDWNVSSGDAGNVKTAEAVYNNLVKGVSKKNVSVVLCHSSKKYTVEAMDDFISWAIKNGYTFKPLTATSTTCHHHINN